MIVQPHLPGTARRDKKPRPVRRSEKVLQAHTRALLGQLGYASFEAGTNRPRVICPKCQCSFVPTGFMGNSKAMPDLLFFRYAPGWPAVAVLIELKGPGTKIDPAQQLMADNGRSVICHSEYDAVRALLAAEIAMDAYRLAPERREQIERFLAMNDPAP
jgi:hypothetical protein